MDDELSFILSNRNPDGVWNITWRWGAFDREFTISENWWKDSFVIQNLLLLRNFGERGDAVSDLKKCIKFRKHVDFIRKLCHNIQQPEISGSCLRALLEDLAAHSRIAFTGRYDICQTMTRGG